MQNLNQYIKKVNRIEFIVTKKCTSHCRHCSVGENTGNETVDLNLGVKAVEDITSVFSVESVMIFGGEPLLYPDTVCGIHKKARECNIPVRQIITNGCFAKEEKRIGNVVKLLEDSGVNDILLSIDCFHEEFLPLEWVRIFAQELCAVYTGRFRLHPSWVIEETADNPYNRRTKECLSYFDDLHIERSYGNIIFPSGNAVKYLSDYFEKKPVDLNFRCGDAPYTAELTDISTTAVNPNGDVVVCEFPIGNILKQDILDIIAEYDPYKNPYTKALINDGINGLIKEVKEQGITIDLSKYYTPCEICRTIAKS